MVSEDRFSQLFYIDILQRSEDRGALPLELVILLQTTHGSGLSVEPLTSFIIVKLGVLGLPNQRSFEDVHDLGTVLNVLVEELRELFQVSVVVHDDVVGQFLVNHVRSQLFYPEHALPNQTIRVLQFHERMVRYVLELVEMGVCKDELSVSVLDELQGLLYLLEVVGVRHLEEGHEELAQSLPVVLDRLQDLSTEV